MKAFVFILLFVVLHIALFAQKQNKYPIAPKDSIVDQYFDTSISDPYQWMENPNDNRLAPWLDKQDGITDKTRRQQIHSRTLQIQLAAMYHQVKTEDLDSYVESEKIDKSKYEFKKKTKDNSRNPDLMYKKSGSSNYFTLVNVKDYQQNRKENIVISYPIVDKDERLALVMISRNGSDWREAYFYDLASGKPIGDTLKYLRIGSQVVWSNNGVYYDRYKKPIAGRALLDKATGLGIYYHQMGTKQDSDQVVYTSPDSTEAENYVFWGENDSLLMMSRYISRGDKTYRALSYASLSAQAELLFHDFIIYPNSKDFAISIEEVIGNSVIVSTDWGAPNGRVIVSKLNEMNSLVELVPEFDVSLKEVNRLGKDKLACIYRNNGKSTVLIYSLAGEMLTRLDFPEGKKIEYFYESDTTVTSTEFCVSSFYHPEIWYQLSLSDYSYKPTEEVRVPYEASKLETRYVKYTSKDGTQVPMYITCLKSTKLNGKNPTLLYAYGGYGSVVEPNFNQSQVLWLLHGGVLAIPNVRGGGVEGSDWGDAGRGLKKQNTIDDFIGAAQYLTQEKYTNADKLVAKGGSHGGMLVAAAAIQKPELFKAVIAEAGVLDMLRFNKFTIGTAGVNILEFGLPTDSLDFINLRSYSPMHNVKEGVRYPNFLLVTGDSDDRVPPLHSYKFLATLQAKANPKGMYQMYVIPGVGHGGGMSNDVFTEKIVFMYYYLFDQTGLEFWKAANGSTF